MQTSVDTPPRSRPWLRWLAALIVVVVAVAVALVVRFATAGGSPEPPSLSEQLSARVVEALEQASAAEHAAHGHHIDEQASGILCAASPFGYEPADATTADEVRTVYAHHMCAVVGPGFGWPDGIRSGGPIAADLGETVTLRTPEQVPAGEDLDYAGRIRALIPEQYQAAALAHPGFVDPAVAEALQRRYEEALD
jgi:hypothetical protein